MLRFVIIAIVVVILVILLVRLFERQMVFFPSKYPAGFRQRQNAGLDLKDVWFTAADGVKLHGWLMPHTQPQVALLMCHGNAGNVSDRYE